MGARDDESVMNSYVSLAILRCASAVAGATVATALASVDADRDNGITLRRMRGSRRSDERATRHVTQWGLRGIEGRARTNVQHPGADIRS